MKYYQLGVLFTFILLSCDQGINYTVNDRTYGNWKIDYFSYDITAVDSKYKSYSYRFDLHDSFLIQSANVSGTWREVNFSSDNYLDINIPNDTFFQIFNRRWRVLSKSGGHMKLQALDSASKTYTLYFIR